MATPTQTQNTRVGSDVELDPEDEEAEEEEVQKLEEEVNQMAQKILQYRNSLPDQLKSSLASVLAAQRPPSVGTLLGSSSGSLPGPSGEANPDIARSAEPGDSALLATRTEEIEKIALLKQKISSNASLMPIVLKRMKDCMARIDQLKSRDMVIHPAFKRKRTT